MAGCGTHEHPSANYFQEKVLYAFDVLILVAEKELGKYEYAILHKAQLQKIPVIIAITKAYDCRNPPLENYKQIVQETTNEAHHHISAYFRNKGLENVPTFIVSAWKYRDLMREEKSFLNIEHQGINGNVSTDGNKLVGQEICDQGVNNPTLIDEEIQLQELVERDIHEKNASPMF